LNGALQHPTKSRDLARHYIILCSAHFDFRRPHLSQNFRRFFRLLPAVEQAKHKLGRYEEARAAFEAAAAQAGNKREHDLLKRRAAEAVLKIGKNPL
jgi:hypothetical protein